MAPTPRGGFAGGHSSPQPTPPPAWPARGRRGLLMDLVARALRWVVRGLGREPGQEERWHVAASHLPELAPCRAGRWDGRLLEVPADLVCLLWLWLR